MKQRKGILTFLIIFCFAFILSTKAYAAPKTERLQGEDRYKTAVAITSSNWQSSENVVLSTGEDFPDALCAAPLASRLNAPILLTGKTSLSSEVSKEVDRLMARNVYIIGGPGVISNDIENLLKLKGINCIRLYGNDRYKTSIEVARYISNKFGSSKEIVVATGEDFPDALSIAPIAAKKGIPIILSPKDSITEDTKRYISENGLSKSYIIGGTGVLSDSIKIQLPNTERISGTDRYTTNRAILDRFAGELNFSTTYIATGENFPDALSGSAIAPTSSSPIVLLSEYSKDTARDFINIKINSINRIVVLGGEGVVPSYLVQIVLTANTVVTNEAPQATISENAKVLDEEKSKQFAETIKNFKVVNEIESVLTFDKSSDNIKSLTPGDIFVVRPTDEMPTGYIGKVISNLTNESGEIVLNVEQPTFDEVFSEVNFKTEKIIKISDIVKADLPEGTKLYASSTKNPSYGYNEFSFKGSIKDSNYNDDIIDELALSFENAVIYKKPKIVQKPGREMNIITLNGKVGLQDTRILVEYDNRHTNPKKCVARMQTTLIGELCITTDLDVSIGTKEIKEAFNLFDNEAKIGKRITIEGVDMEDEIVLASLTVGFGAIPVQVKYGAPVMVPLGGAILLTMSYEGTINAKIDTNVNYSCYVDAGVEYNKKTGFTHHNTFKTKSVWPEVTISGSGTATLKSSIGVSVAIIAMNIIPAKINAKIKSETETEGVLKYSTLEGSSRDMKFSKEIKFVVDAATAFGVEVEYRNKKREKRWEYEVCLIEKSLWKEKYPKDKVGNTSGNISNGGYVAESGDYIYLIQADGVDEDGFGKYNLYKRKKDTGKMERITDFNNGGDTFFKFINVIDDWIYYTGGGINKLKIDGTQKTVVLKKNVEPMIVVGNWIYYHVLGTIGKVKTDGTYDMKLFDVKNGMFDFSVEDDWIYYSTNDGIYKAKTDGTENKKITSVKTTTMNVDGEWIYYVTENGINRIKNDGTSNTLILPVSYLEGINISEGYIYYFSNFTDANSGSNTRIGKIMLDGTRQKILYEGQGRTLALNIGGEWMFYATNHHGSANEKMMQKNVDEHWEQ